MKDRNFYINLIVTIVLWGSAFVGIKFTMGNIAPGPMALLRFIVASIVIAPFFLTYRKRIFPKKDLPMFALSGFLGFFLYNITLNMGETIVSGGVASFLISSLTIFTGIFSAIFFKERLSFISWIGIIISFIGIGIISLDETSIINHGALLVILSAICSSLYILIQKVLIPKYGSFNTLVWSIWFGTSFMCIYSFQLLDSFRGLDNSTIATIIYLGIFPGTIAYFTWNRALELSTSATKTTTALYFTPLAATILEWIVLGVTPLLTTIFGGLIVLLGVYITSKRGDNGKKDC